MKSGEAIGLIRVAVAEIEFTEMETGYGMDFGYLELLPELITVSEYLIEVIHKGHIRVLWGLPAHFRNNYKYCPDVRIKTHRLIGKPSSGPSPPAINQILIKTTPAVLMAG